MASTDTERREAKSANMAETAKAQEKAEAEARAEAQKDVAKQEAKVEKQVEADRKASEEASEGMTPGQVKAAATNSYPAMASVPGPIVPPAVVDLNREPLPGEAPVDYPPKDTDTPQAPAKPLTGQTKEEATASSKE